MLLVGFRGRERRERLVPLVPAVWLAVGIVFLVGLRAGLNVADSNVIDVGYSGVIGADRIVDGDELYGDGFAADNERGDTYGPANYLFYVPFEQTFTWSGAWDDLPAARGAALAADLLVLLGLMLLGRRLRPGEEGKTLGLALAFAWAAYPYSAFALESNSNDTLIAVAVVGALLATGPALRGVAIGLGAAAKFAPLALAPLFATAGGERRTRHVVVFALALAAAVVVTVAPFVPDGGLRELYDRTVGYQAGRPSPFSIWGQEPSLEWLQTVVKVAAAGLALLVAFVPRRKSPAQLAALAAAVLVAVQLTMTHWFYLYVVWFAPLCSWRCSPPTVSRARQPRPRPSNASWPRREARGDRIRGAACPRMDGDLVRRPVGRPDRQRPVRVPRVRGLLPRRLPALSRHPVRVPASCRPWRSACPAYLAPARTRTGGRSRGSPSCSRRPSCGSAAALPRAPVATRAARCWRPRRPRCSPAR